jgi:hypothetical protein
MTEPKPIYKIEVMARLVSWGTTVFLAFGCSDGTQPDLTREDDSNGVGKLSFEARTEHPSTTHGPRAQECLQELPNGAVVSLANGTASLNGKVVATQPPCPGSPIPAIYVNEDVELYAPTHNGMDWFNHMYTYWYVPQDPSYHEQTGGIHLWTGLAPGYGVLYPFIQPVLSKYPPAKPGALDSVSRSKRLVLGPLTSGSRSHLKVALHFHNLS